MIVGDVAGRLKLLEKMMSRFDKVTPVIFAGDLIDKGPSSCDVLQAIIRDPRCHMVLGNHEVMMMKAIQEISPDMTPQNLKLVNLWLERSGLATVRSYYPKFLRSSSILSGLLGFKEKLVESGHLQLLQESPIVIALPKLLISHSPADLNWVPKSLYSFPQLGPTWTIGVCNKTDQAWISSLHRRKQYRLPQAPRIETFVNSRCQPTAVPGFLHVFGHMSRWGLKSFGGKAPKCNHLCIDTSRSKSLTAMHWPSGELIQIN